MVGTIQQYEVETEDGVESVTIGVPDETREVMGVTTRVVRDQVFLEGLIAEHTRLESVRAGIG